MININIIFVCLSILSGIGATIKMEGDMVMAMAAVVAIKKEDEEEIRQTITIGTERVGEMIGNYEVLLTVNIFC